MLTNKRKIVLPITCFALVMVFMIGIITMTGRSLEGSAEGESDISSYQIDALRERLEELGYADEETDSSSQVEGDFNNLYEADGNGGTKLVRKFDTFEELQQYINETQPHPLNEYEGLEPEMTDPSCLFGPEYDNFSFNWVCLDFSDDAKSDGFYRCLSTEDSLAILEEMSKATEVSDTGGNYNYSIEIHVQDKNKATGAYAFELDLENRVFRQFAYDQEKTPYSRCFMYEKGGAADKIFNAYNNGEIKIEPVG